MIGFIEELWQSVFTPGASPVLIICTHVTFAFLVLSLISMIFLSNFNLHLVFLLLIALALWGLLTWFISELEAYQDKLEKEEKLKKDDKEKEKDSKLETIKDEEETKTSGKSTSTSTSSTKKRSRKV